jgi:DNA-binding response OmpR family regulator
MDGFDLCRSIKKNARWLGIPVLFLTGWTGKEDMEAGMKVGADGYLTKPFELKQLMAKVEEFLDESYVAKTIQ